MRIGQWEEEVAGSPTNSCDLALQVQSMSGEYHDEDGEGMGGVETETQKDGSQGEFVTVLR